MTNIKSVRFIPAGESIDSALGEPLWGDRDAIERFVGLWETEAERLLGVPVSISRRCDFANESRLVIDTGDDTDTGDDYDYDAREEVGDRLDDAYATAVDRLAAESACRAASGATPREPRDAEHGDGAEGRADDL